jgi:hypothetical protein
MTAIDQARDVADAVLYEGYLLYPYRASAQKNQRRFQFGVLMPPAYADPSERKGLCAECLVECADDAVLRILIRYLRLHPRPGTTDEAEEQEHPLTLPVRDLLQHESRTDIHTATVDSVLRAKLSPLDGPYGALRLTISLDNTTDTEVIEQRDVALRHALVAAHLIVEIPGGGFPSMTDPPRWAAEYAAECVNEGVWPVLAGSDLMLFSPIILNDHPELAPESPAALYDSTEIDEILLLRTMALTDEEKREARATDPRAAAVIDRADALSPDILDRLHGAIRSLRSATGEQPPPTVPWWDPENDASVDPETDEIVISGVAVARGSTVVMRPGSRRADAQDLFLAGRPALVEAVLHDVDGNIHLAVTPQDDPDADLHGLHGRYLYFAPDEVTPL